MAAELLITVLSSIQRITLKVVVGSIVLKNSVSGSSEKFLASMACFALSDMRGHKK
jgi:hypothetical protein